MKTPLNPTCDMLPIFDRLATLLPLPFGLAALSRRRGGREESRGEGMLPGSEVQYAKFWFGEISPCTLNRVATVVLRLFALAIVATASCLQAQSVTNGLAVYLNFDSNIVAQANTLHSGTAIGAAPTPKYTAGLIGTAAAIFDNDGSGTTPGDWAVSLGDIETIYAGTWSFSFWVNATNGNDGALFGNKDWTAGANVGWLVDPSRMSFLNYTAQGSARHDVGGVNILDGNWHQVAAVFDRTGNQVSVYVDGAMKTSASLGTAGTESLTPSTFSPNATLVGGSGNGLYSGAGAVDDLGIWTRALSSADVLAIYAQGLQGQPLTTAVAGTGVKPLISSAPQSQTVYAGFDVDLSVAASGSLPLFYQWYQNAKPLIGATNTDLKIPSVTTNALGSYFVVVSNLFGSVTSSPPATLTVLPVPTNIMAGLVVYLNFDSNIVAQAGTTNSATAIGSVGVATYTNGVIGTAAAIFANDQSGGPAASDWAASLGDVEWIYSNNWTFSIWVKTTDKLGAVLGNKDWNSGANIGWLISEYYQNFLNYNAVNSPRHDIGNYNWADNKWHHVAAVFYRDINTVFTYVDGAPTASAALSTTGTESLTPANIVPNATLIGSSGNGSYSAAAAVDDLGVWARPLNRDELLSIYAQGLKGQPLTTAVANAPIRPQIATAPQNEIRLAGLPAAFSVVATGSNPLFYQWYRNGMALSGQTNASLTFTALLSDSGSAYTVSVSNRFGSVTNGSPAILTVLPGASSITNNLIVYLNFDSNLVAQAGTQISATPVGNSGVPKFTNGIIGAAALFENDQTAGPAASDWAASLGDVEWVYTNNWSFSLWVNTTDTLGAVFGNKDWNSGGNIGWLISEYYTNFCNYRAVDSGRHDIGSFNWADRKWHHVAVVFYRDANTAYTFVDGQLTDQASLSNTGTESLTPTNIVPNATLVGSSGNGSYSANAAVDDLAMWTRPLTPAEISGIYQGGLAGLDLLHAGQGVPKLAVAISGKNLVLTYPSSATNFSLMSSTNLVTRLWSLLNVSPNVTGGTATVTLPLGTGDMFFRLQR
jgi:hypothetical protein